MTSKSEKAIRPIAGLPNASANAGLAGVHLRRLGANHVLLFGRGRNAVGIGV